MVQPLGYTDAPDFLDLIEAAHRDAVGRVFCYHQVRYGTSDLFRLVVVRGGEYGYYPISDDFFIGSQSEARDKAESLNSHRLNLTTVEAAKMVAKSMTQKNK